ncbi:MAG: hypothetical protein ACE5GB_04025 [Acidimicrobiales bacterium]
MSDGDTTRRVLVVSDRRDVGKFLTRLIENAGHDTGACRGEDVAVELSSAMPRFDVVLGDAIDVATVSRVRSLSEDDRAATPIVVLAAENATDASREAILAAGAGAWLRRPIAAAELVDAVENAAAGASDDR